MDLLTLTAVLLTAAVLTGVAHTFQFLRGARVPVALHWAHGLCAVGALVVLLLLAVTRPSVLVIASAAVAFTAGLGGVFMYRQRRRGALLTIGALVTHGPFELVALVLCWMAVFAAR